MLKMSTIHASSRLAKTPFFFLLMNNSSSGLMSYCTLAIEFLALKIHTGLSERSYKIKLKKKKKKNYCMELEFCVKETKANFLHNT